MKCGIFGEFSYTGTHTPRLVWELIFLGKILRSNGKMGSGNLDTETSLCPMPCCRAAHGASSSLKSQVWTFSRTISQNVCGIKVDPLSHCTQKEDSEKLQWAERWVTQETPQARTGAPLVPLASEGPFGLVLASGRGSILLDVRVGRGAVQSGIWGWGPSISGQFLQGRTSMPLFFSTLLQSLLQSTGQKYHFQSCNVLPKQM